MPSFVFLHQVRQGDSSRAALGDAKRGVHLRELAVGDLVEKREDPGFQALRGSLSYSPAVSTRHRGHRVREEVRAVPVQTGGDGFLVNRDEGVGASNARVVDALDVVVRFFCIGVFRAFRAL